MTTKITHKLEHQEVVAIYRMIEEITPSQSSNLTIMMGFLLSQVKRKLKSKLVDDKTRYKLQINLAEAIAINDYVSGLEATPDVWINLLLQRIMSDNDQFIVQFKTSSKNLKES